MDTQLDFDPYQSWLRIDHPSRPLTPYQLLGLEACEDNPNRIDAAIRKQRLLLEGQRSGADPGMWQQVKDELEQAVDQLLKPEKKSLLDASLRRSHRTVEFRESLGQRQLPTVNGTLTCGACEHGNPGERHFCARCGQMLWQECIQCDSLCAANEIFCGSCGTNLEEAERKARQQHQSTLDEARHLMQNHHFDEGTRLARRIARLEDPRFNRLTEYALQLIDEASLSKRRWQQRAEASLKKAQSLVEQHAFAEITELIQRIPSPLWTDELRHLYQVARAKHSESAALLQEIKAAVKAKDVMAIAPRVERLLTLVPEHEQGRQLALQAGERLNQLAKVHLNEHRFRQAIDVLQLVPAIATNDTTRKLLNLAKELSWLRCDALQSPVVDPALPGIVERYIELAPGNRRELQELGGQLQQRLATGPSDPRPYPSWSTCPQDPHMVCPVEWLAQFGSTKIASTAQETIDQHPGEFFVAAGLALQGVRPVHVPTNLLKSLRNNSRFSFAKWNLKSLRADGPQGVAWGIDIGNHSLKAVQLAATADGSVEVQHAVHMPFPSPLSRPENEGKHNQLLGSALQQLQEKTQLSKEHAVFASITTQSVLGRFVQFPVLDPKQVPAAVEYEMKHQMPYGLEDLAWDYHHLGSDLSADQRIKIRPTTVLLAAKKSAVDAWLEALESGLGFSITGLQPDVIALMNWIVHDRLSTAGEDSNNSPVMILDVGSLTSSLVIASPLHLWFRNVGYGGDRFSQAIAKAMSLTFTQAEQLRYEPCRAKRLHTIFERLEPEFSDLADEIDRCVKLYQKQFGTRPRTIWACGGAFRCHGLYRHLVHGPHFSRR